MMNKKIEKLAEQCGFRSNPDIYDRNQSFDIEKFAELIVRECANIIESQDVDPTFRHRMAWAVKQRFGVEE
jgi:hypothetical protein